MVANFCHILVISLLNDNYSRIVSIVYFRDALESLLLSLKVVGMTSMKLTIFSWFVKNFAVQDDIADF